MKKTICLVDGSGYIFRAFYALPPMTNPQGTPVNAVYGFTNMFLKLTASIKCDYSLVLFDAKRANFRNEIFAQYKGTRAEIPENLIPQFSLIRDAVDALNLNHLEMEGYEADDLIATYAKQAKDAGLEVVIVSADKDLMQLIGEGVQLYDPMKDKFFSPEDVKEKFGVYPDKVVDVQALSGDSIDNVPGVPGIGPKTAAELINEYGSLEGVLQNAEKIKQNKRREMLIEHAEAARISLQLVRLKKDVPVEHNFDFYKCKKPEYQKIMQFVDLHEFKTIRPRVEKWLAEQCSDFDNRHKAEIVPHYTEIETEKDLEKCCAEIEKQRMFSLLFLADGENPLTAKICGLAIGTGEGRAYYIKSGQAEECQKLDLFNAPQKYGISPDILKKHFSGLLASRSILKIGAQIKNDMHIARRLFGTEVFPIDDVSVMSYVLDGTTHSHDIKTMAKVFIDYDMKYAENTKAKGNEVEVSHKDTMCEKADLIFRLYEQLKPELVKSAQTAVYENFDRPLISVLQKMEENGIMVDGAALIALKQNFEEKLKAIENQVYDLAGEQFNIASPKQVGEILFGKLGLKGKKSASGAMQTGADILEQLAAKHELPAKILEWRGFAKLKSTYTDSLLSQLDNNSRIHTTFSQITVNTGRLSSFNPNLQNIPIRTEDGRKIRSVFVAPHGSKIVSADYSQVELRLLADVADVKLLKQSFADGVDVHAATAAKVFGLDYHHVDAAHRRKAKAINFGIVYGISQYGLAKQTDTTPQEAKQYIDNYFAAMPEIKEYMAKTEDFAAKHGYVETPFGRKCVIFGINDANKRMVSFAQRAAINAPIQGGAADIIKIAMQKVCAKLEAMGLLAKLLLQVHDELVLEVPDDEVEVVRNMLKETMENAVKISVKFEVEVGVGQNWAEAH